MSFIKIFGSFSCKSYFLIVFFCKRMLLSTEQLRGILHWQLSWSHFSKWHHSVNPQCILYTSMCDVSFHFRCRCCSYGRRGFFLDGFPYDRDAADGTSGVHKRQSQAVSCLNCGTFIPCDTTSSNRLDLNSNVPPTRFLPWDYFGGLWHHLGTFHNVMGSLEASFKLVITQTAFRLPPQSLIWEDGQFQICSDFHFFRF